MHPVFSVTLIKRCSFLLVLGLGILIGCAQDEVQPEPAPPAPTAIAEEQQAPSNIDKMQGKWQSRDDQAAVIGIDGDQFTSWYDTEKLSTGTLTFVNNCDEQAAEPEGDYFVVRDQSGALCYYLSHVDRALLEYSYVRRGNTLSYTRIE